MSFWLSKFGCSRLDEAFQVSSPWRCFQLVLVDPEVFIGQMRYLIPPATSGSTLEHLPVGCDQKTSKGRTHTPKTTSAGVFSHQPLKLPVNVSEAESNLMKDLFVFSISFTTQSSWPLERVGMWTDWQIQRFLFTTILRYLPDYSVVSTSWPAVTSWSLIVTTLLMKSLNLIQNTKLLLHLLLGLMKMTYLVSIWRPLDVC